MLLPFALSLAANFVSPFKENFTYDDIVKYLKAHPKIKTVEQFLPLLPQSYRSGYTLMHSTHSRQDASPENPRAILYGRDARLLLAFNGSPTQNGFNTLEAIQFHDEGARFEMHRLTFKKNGVEYSEANPTECLECHGDDPRPNWEQYSVWEGAYGANHDIVDDDAPPVRAALKDFLLRGEKDPRYGTLVGLKEGYSHPWLTTFQQHNEDFTQRVFMLNFRRVSRLLRALPKYPQLKYALAGLLECRKEWRKFVPDEKLSAFAGLDEERAKARETLGSVNSTTADILPQFLKRAGIETDFWSTNFVSPYASFTTPGVPDAEFLAFWVGQDPDFAPFFRVDAGEYRGAYAPQAQFLGTCEALAEASLKVWKD